MDSAEHDHDDFGGLGRDLPRLVGRRQALQWLGGIGLVGLVAACGSGGGSPAATAATAASAASAGGSSAGGSTSGSTAAGGAAPTTTATTATSAGAEIPDETAGPFPADGSNGPNVLSEQGIVRADVTTSFGDTSGTAEGIPATIQLTVVDAGTGAALAGAAVYLWHCTADGRYSIYEVTDQNYLRGVQETDDAGRATFTSVFPGCYAGRWPHCHFEVYTDLDQAGSGRATVKTSQLALPQAECEQVYADSRYGDSAQNLGRQSLTGDNVFRDGWEDQLATVAGSAADGYTVSLLVRA